MEAQPLFNENNHQDINDILIDKDYLYVHSGYQYGNTNSKTFKLNKSDLTEKTSITPEDANTTTMFFTPKGRILQSSITYNNKYLWTTDTNFTTQEGPIDISLGNNTSLFPEKVLITPDSTVYVGYNEGVVVKWGKEGNLSNGPQKDIDETIIHYHLGGTCTGLTYDIDNLDEGKLRDFSATDFTNATFPETNRIQINSTIYDFTENVIKHHWNTILLGVSGDQYNGEAYTVWNNVSDTIKSTLEFVLYSADGNGDIYQLSEDLLTVYDSFTQGGSFNFHGENLTYGNDGYLYGADYGSNIVRKIDPITMEEIHSVTVSKGYGIIYTPENYLFVQDDSNKTIVKVNPTTMQIVTTSTNFGDVAGALRYYKGSILVGDDSTLYKLDHDTLDVITSKTINTLILCITAYNDTIFIGNNYNNIDKRDFSTLDLIETFIGHSGQLQSLVFGSDKNIYSCAKDNTIRKINPDTMTQIGNSFSSTSYCRGLCYAPNNKLYFCDKDNRTGRIEPSTMTKDAEFKGHNNDVNGGIVYSLKPSQTQDKSLDRLLGGAFKVASFLQQNQVEVLGERYNLTTQILKNNWNKIVIGYSGDQVAGEQWDFWNTISSTIKNNVEFVIFSADNNGDIYQLSSDLSTVYDSFTNGGGFESHGHALSFGFDGYLYASDYVNNSIYKINPSSMSIYTTSKVSISSSRAIIYTPEKYIYTTEESSPYDVIQFDTNMEEIHRFTDFPTNIYGDIRYYNGQVFFGGNYNGTTNNLRQIDNYTMKQINAKSYSNDNVIAITGSYNNIYVGTSGNIIDKLDITTLNTLGTYTGQSGNINHIVGSPDGNIYSASSDSTIHKIDVSDMTQIGDTFSSTNSIFSLCYAPNDKIYFSDDDARTGRVEPSTMNQDAEFTGHSDVVRGGIVYAIKTW